MSETAPALLSLNGVSKRYGKVQANFRIDLSVHAGTIHAILGENGAGKSTLMKLIYGVETPDEGTISWNGKTVEFSSPADAQRHGIGMVFQHFSLFETLNVVQNVSLLVPGTQAELIERIKSLGDKFGLSINPRAMVHTLSVGERQRVEIIRCLLLDPKLLILDEPTSVLPPQSVTLLFETLRMLRDRGIAILFISHKLDEIRELCDTATILRAGEVTGRVDPRSHDSGALARLMIGREIPKIDARTQHQIGEVKLSITRLSAGRQTAFGTSLSEVNLQVRGGQIVGIAGISGNGQQELAALISGEVRHAQAECISIKGQAVGNLGPAQRRELGFSFIPEERLGRGAVPAMTLAENSLLTGKRAGLVKNGFISRRAERQFTAHCISAFDVKTAGPDVEAATLSGGNLQKYILGREISLKPDVMLISQPTWGVDIGASTAIRKRLIEMRDAGVALLIISEELEELFELCDVLHVMHKGKLSEALDPRVISASRVGAYMIGAGEQSTAAEVHA